MARQSDGRVSSIRASSKPIPVASNSSPEVRARSFLADYRALFVNTTTPLDLNLQRTSPSATNNARHVRFAQSYKGIPVRGAEAIVHLNTVGVTSVQSTLFPDLAKVNVTPKIAASHALSSAAAMMRAEYPSITLNYAALNLEIVNVDFLFGRTAGESRLAWFTEARGLGVREFLWVDALDGSVLTHFSQIAHAFIDNGYVSDYAGACAVAVPVATYAPGGVPPISGTEAEIAFNNAAAAYDYFLDTFNREISGASPTTSAKILMNLCDADFLPLPLPLPLVLEKASWDGNQMLFATGVSVADDIVGHEYTHALLDNETGISSASPTTYMVGQTGALAEGFADIFGEVIDLVKNTTNDAGDTRWDIGEEITGGPFRNLMSPGSYNLPEKTSDINAYCGDDEDIRIHTNGAVLAHAFALATDGGTYNGISISPIGIAKAAEIFYRAMTEYMTSVSSFVQVYDGLISVADDLEAASTLTPSDRTQLVKALNAVELNKSPCNTHLDYCPTGQGAQPVFGDDFETISSGKWENSVVGPVVNHWNTGAGSPNIYHKANTTFKITPYNGTYSLWADGDRGGLETGGKVGDSVVEMAKAVTVPANGRMQFEGKFTFEGMDPETMQGADGGFIEYSVNGGVWQNAGSLIDAGQAYTGTIQDGQGNPLANAPAFVGTNGSYHSTQLNLQSLAGQSVRFRFRVGTDNFGGYMGWLIDDVSIYSCSPAGLVVTPTSGLTTSEAGGTATFTVSLAEAPSSTVYLEVASNNTAEGTVDKLVLDFSAADYSQPQTVTVKGVDDSSVDGSQNYTVTVRVSTSNDQGYKNLAPVVVSLVNTDNDGGKKKSGGGDIGLFVIGMLIFGWLARHCFIGRRRAAPARFVV